MTPEIGLLTADTWVAFATWLRNTLLNQIILISGLLFLALLPHVLALAGIVPRRFPAVATAVGAIFYLFLVAVYFVGRELPPRSPNLNAYAESDSPRTPEAIPADWTVLSSPGIPPNDQSNLGIPAQVLSFPGCFEGVEHNLETIGDCEAHNGGLRHRGG